MSKVYFTYFKGGKTKAMSKKHGDILQKMKLGTYQTRDMAADRPEPLLDRQMTAEPKRRGRPPGVKPVESAPDPTVEPVAPVSEQPITESTEPKGDE